MKEQYCLVCEEARTQVLVWCSNDWIFCD